MQTDGADRRGRGVKEIVIVITMSIVCSAAAIAVYDLFFAQKIVAVDLVSSIASQKEDYAAGKITADELVENIEGLVRQIGKKRRNEILVLEEAVAGDVKHYNLAPAHTAADEEDNRER